MSEKNGAPNGCVASAYIGLIVFSVVTLFIGSVVMFVSQTYSLVVYPNYESTIVDVGSEWVEKDYEDDNGFTRSEMVEMHTAVLEFYDGSGELIRLNNNIRSGAKPVINEKLTIAYRDGKLHEFSLRSILILVGLTTIMIILGSISACFLLFAFNKKTDSAQAFAWGFVFYFVVPAGMLLMMCAMSWAVWDHHANNGDMPIWAQGVAIFFSFVIFLSFIHYAGLALKRIRKRIDKALQNKQT